MSKGKLWAWTNALGLLLGVVGGVMLALSLDLRTTSFSLATVPGGFQLCHNGHVIQATFGGPLGEDPAEPCAPEAGPAPIIVANHTTLAKWGLWLVILGFVGQFPAALRAIHDTK